MPPPELKLLRLCSSPSLGADYGLPQSRPGPWLHSGDLEYLPGHLSIETWSDFRIVSFLEEHVISIPPYRDGRSDPLVVISSCGETTIVPMGYRVPLLWLAKVQWESLKIAVTVHCSLWDIIKLDLVYISRLTATFLAHAREAGVRAASGQIDKRWRDPMFDRVMTRFFVGWMGCRDVFVEEFYKEFKDEEYKEDVVRRRWAQKVVCPGIGGFTLTTRELKDGGDAHEFLSGLTLDRDNLTFHFAPEPQSPSAMSSPLSSLESDEEEGDLTPLAHELPIPSAVSTPLSSLDSDDDLLRGSHNVSLPAPRVHLSLSSKSDDEGDVPAESRGHWPPHFPEVPHTHEAAMSAMSAIVRAAESFKRHGVDGDALNKVAEGGKGGPVVKMEVDTEELNYDNGYEVDYIEVDRDGLRTVRDCVGAVFDPDSVCRFCTARYDDDTRKGEGSEAPLAMAGQTLEVLAAHCEAVHPYAWELLRHNT